MNKLRGFFSAALAMLLICILFSGCTRMPEEMVTVPTPKPTPTPEICLDESLTAVFTEEDMAKLDFYPNLRTLDLSGSRCYDAILAYMQAHPEVSTTYTVEIQGSGPSLEIRNTDTSVSLEDVSYIDNLVQLSAYLPKLETIRLSEQAVDAEHFARLREAFPEAQLPYEVNILGTPYDSETTELDLTALTPADVDAVIPALQKLFQLSSVSLSGSDSENGLSSADVAKLSAACPNVSFAYRFTLFGQEISTADERIEFVNADIGNAGVDQIRAILPSMSQLNYLVLDDCGVDNEVMAQLRDDYPEIKVVWRVHFGKYHCLTDTEMIWATGGTVNDGTSEPLKYCTDVKYLDMGHDLMTHIDFVRYMPKLEVAIFAISWVADISPLAECPNLEYLEIFSSDVTDITPLASCTHLQHLNISNLSEVRDITCLYNLTELKRLYCTMSYIPADQQEEIRRLLPDCEFEFGWVDPAEGHWRFKDGNKYNNVPDNRVERYALLYEQFGYDTYQQSGVMWSLYD